MTPSPNICQEPSVQHKLFCEQYLTLLQNAALSEWLVAMLAA